MDDARQRKGLRLPGVLICVATMLALGVSIVGDGVSDAQLVAVAVLAFVSGLFAAWTTTQPGARS